MIVILRRFEMLAKVNTFALSGLEGYKVDVEESSNNMVTYVKDEEE